MKRRGLITVLAALMVMLSAAMVSADEDALKLVSSYPEDGQTNTSIENVGVQLHFNHAIANEDTQAHNQECVKIVDEDGKEIPIKVLAKSSEEGLLLVLGDSTDESFEVENNSEYTLVVSADFMDDEGNTLGEETTVTFKTFNQRLNNIINMVLMFAIFGGIMVMTLRQQTQNQQGQEKKEAEEKKDSTFNPYKEAKRTGKSVEQVIEEERQKQAKAAKKAARKNKNKEEEDYVKDSKLKLSEILPNVYGVSGPRPISAAGGKYKGRRGVQEEEAPKVRGSRNNGNKDKR